MDPDAEAAYVAKMQKAVEAFVAADKRIRDAYYRHALKQITPCSEEQRKRFYELEQGTEEWLKARVGIVTGSTFGGLIGANPYTKAHIAAVTMADGKEPDLGKSEQEKKESRENMDRGKRLEPLGRERYLQRLKAEAEQQGFQGTIEIDVPGLIVHPDLPWLAASPDGIVKVNGKPVRIVEFKAPKRQRPVHPVPPYYLVQVWAQMMCTGVFVCDFVHIYDHGDNHVGIDLGEVRFDPVNMLDKALPEARDAWLTAVASRILVRRLLSPIHKLEGAELEKELQKKLLDKTTSGVNAAAIRYFENYYRPRWFSIE